MNRRRHLGGGMHLRCCAACRAYWANNAAPSITAVVNRLCPDCIAGLPALTFSNRVYVAGTYSVSVGTGGRRPA